MRINLALIKKKKKKRVGCALVPNGTWKTAPLDTYIIGLKELPENDDSPISHTHIFFAHCYKNQAGWQDIIRRFVKGNGVILDMEFLTDEKGNYQNKNIFRD